MPSDFDDYVAPSWVDPDAFLYCGADPAWTPAREIGMPKDADVRGDAECILCHGDGVPLTLPDGSEAILAGEVAEGSHRVCGRCMRYGLDGRLGIAEPATGNPSEPLPSREGYVAKGNVEVPERFAKMLKG